MPHDKTHTPDNQPAGKDESTGMEQTRTPSKSAAFLARFTGAAAGELIAAVLGLDNWV